MGRARPGKTLGQPHRKASPPPASLSQSSWRVRAGVTTSGLTNRRVQASVTPSQQWQPPGRGGMETFSTGARSVVDLRPKPLAPAPPSRGGAGCARVKKRSDADDVRGLPVRTPRRAAANGRHAAAPAGQRMRATMHWPRPAQGGGGRTGPILGPCGSQQDPWALCRQGYHPPRVPPPPHRSQLEPTQ